jgi:hypothetical protein
MGKFYAGGAVRLGMLLIVDSNSEHSSLDQTDAPLPRVQQNGSFDSAEFAAARAFVVQQPRTARTLRTWPQCQAYGTSRDKTPLGKRRQPIIVTTTRCAAKALHQGAACVI